MYKDILLSIYDRLYKTFGPQHWWPGETKFEIMVGAILTQNTSWQNVEKAIGELRKRDMLSFDKLKKVPVKELASLIKSCGYYNVKAKRLKSFFDFLAEKGGVDGVFKEDSFVLRGQLLRVNGIGPETADSILLYAGHMPFFVVDAYTKRILRAHKIIDEKAGYEEVQNLFMDNLKCDEKLFNEYHALIVRLGKEYCKTKPKCDRCPLKGVNEEWRKREIRKT
ncbi:MAG: endonuclease III domain-containing protein [Candidatus Omnitrophota bacterium]